MTVVKKLVYNNVEDENGSLNCRCRFIVVGIDRVRLSPTSTSEGVASLQQYGW